MQGKYTRMEELRREEESRQQRIIKMKEDLAAAELEFENLPPYEPPKDEIVSYCKIWSNVFMNNIQVMSLNSLYLIFLFCSTVVFSV